VTPKTLLRTHASVRDDIGDLVTRRPLPGPQLAQLDPFLFLNHHGPQVYPPGNRGLPFGPHPHRGFETVTFILQGELTHKDTGGHESVIHAGGVQWMTAGSGLVHAEVSSDAFKDRGGPLEILQLWVNLPPRLKMSAPRYVGLQAAEIPAIRLAEGGVIVHLVSGSFDGHDGAMKSLTGVFMSVVEMHAGTRVAFPDLEGRNVFLYVVEGSIRIGGVEARGHTLAELSSDGDSVEIDAAADATLLFGHADPIGAPVASYGPFVMNTREEIQEAVRDYQAGKFGSL
jgi:redox-sensitive bicupin YhaK (pirin superfamily)